MAVVTSAVIAAGATAYSAYSSSQNQKAAAAAQQAGGPQNAGAVFGQPVKPVKYKTLWDKDPGYVGATRQVIGGDITNLKNATMLSSGINRGITASSKERIGGLDPTFFAALSQLYSNRNNELQGNLPFSDMQNLMANRGRNANDYGQAGGSTPQSAQDLGLSRLSLMNQGADLTQSITNILNGIDPVSRYATPQDYLISPQQAIPWSIQDNQFGATFKAQQNAIAAMADPRAAGLFNQQQFNAGLQGQGGGGNGQMWGAVAQGIGGIAKAYAGSQGAGATGADMGALGAYNQAAGSYGQTTQMPSVAYSAPAGVGVA